MFYFEKLLKVFRLSFYENLNFLDKKFDQFLLYKIHLATNRFQVISI